MHNSGKADSYHHDGAGSDNDHKERQQQEQQTRRPHLRAGFCAARPPCLPLCGLNTAGELQLNLAVLAFSYFSC